MGVAGHLHAAQPRPRTSRCAASDEGRRQGLHVVQLGQPRRGASSTNPWLFDVTRDPNPHIGYGAGGAHFCLGANLARREIRVMFEELHRQVPDIVAIEEPAILQSAFIHGIKRLPV